MHPPKSPIVAAWALALRLRQRREQLGMDVRSITEAMNFTRNYWSAVENERKLLSEESLLKIIDLFEFDAAEGRELLELRALAKERGWWTGYPEVLSASVQRLYGLEADAHSIRTYESLLVPGLLQTADYAKAIMTPDVTIRQVEVDQRVQVRLRRQQRLSDDNPLRLTTVISEAVLHQQIGGPEVHRSQLEHFLTMTEEHPDTIDIRVIPFTVKSCGLFGAATVHVIDFENPGLPEVAWQESITVRGFIEDPRLIHDITTAYSEAFGLALSVQESTELIRRCIEEPV